MAVTGGCGVNFPPREGGRTPYSECGVAVVQPDSLHPDSLHGDQVCDGDLNLNYLKFLTFTSW